MHAVLTRVRPRSSCETCVCVSPLFRMIAPRASLDWDKFPNTRVASSTASMLELSSSFIITGVGENQQWGVKRRTNTSMDGWMRQVVRRAYVSRSWAYSDPEQSFLLAGRRTDWRWRRPRWPPAPRFGAQTWGLKGQRSAASRVVYRGLRAGAGGPPICA